MDRQAITPQPQARNARGGRRGEGLFVSRGRPKGRGKRLSGPKGPDPLLRSRGRGAAVLRSDQPLERPPAMPDVSTEKAPSPSGGSCRLTPEGVAVKAATPMLE